MSSDLPVPVEIVGKILSHVEDDLYTLASCVLASKAMSACAQPLLYRTLHLVYVVLGITNSLANGSDARTTCLEWPSGLLAGTAPLSDILEHLPLLEELDLDFGQPIRDYWISPSPLSETLPLSGTFTASLRVLKNNTFTAASFALIAKLPKLESLHLQLSSSMVDGQVGASPAFQLRYICIDIDNSCKSFQTSFFAPVTARSHASLAAATLPYSFSCESLLSPFRNLTNLTLTGAPGSPHSRSPVYVFPGPWHASRIQALTAFLASNTVLRILTLSFEQGPAFDRPALLASLPLRLEALLLRPFHLSAFQALAALPSVPTTLRSVRWTASDGTKSWTDAQKEQIKQACEARGIKAAFSVGKASELDG
ncbi:hypothetical protein JCM10213v2_007869 [Rhodosporidiobolus nylandii]